jgi:isopenicillin N synthase-like dioxygenase
MTAPSSLAIPVVNLDDFVSGSPQARAQFIRTLGGGLKEFGFITVGRHGIDLGLIRDAYRLFAELFALDDATKQKYSGIKGGQRGYTGFGVEHAKDHPVGDLKEFWHIGPELPAGHRYASVYPANVWPSELPELKRVTTTLFSQLNTCVASILHALADYFELPRDTFSKMAVDGNSVMRAIHYPPLPADADPRAVRAAAHEDINLITVLCEATSSGLELLTRSGEWMAIDALEGQIVVDAGDMLQRVTNYVIPATTHRVVNPPGDANLPRYSLPFFVHPYPECVLEALPCCVTPDNPAKYPPITADEFLNERLREIGLLK